MPAPRLDEHHLGTEIGERTPADRSRLPAEFEDAQSSEQWFHASPRARDAVPADVP
jgi:hypothetical protein